MAKTVLTSVRKFVIAGDQIYGDDTTRSPEDLIRMLNLGMAEMVMVAKQGGLAKALMIEGAQEIAMLPKKCPAVGTVIYFFYRSGRIDRFQVIKKDRLVAYMKRRADDRLPDKLEANYEPRKVGQCLSWDGRESKYTYSNKCSLRVTERIERILIDLATEASTEGSVDSDPIVVTKQMAVGL